MVKLHSSCVSYIKQHLTTNGTFKRFVGRGFKLITSISMHTGNLDTRIVYCDTLRVREIVYPGGILAYEV